MEGTAAGDSAVVRGQEVSDCDSNEGENPTPRLANNANRKFQQCCTCEETLLCNRHITPELSAATERTKVSDQNSTYILATAAKSFGHYCQQKSQ